MKIRDDYIGNSRNTSETVHGLKKAERHWMDPHVLLCGTTRGSWNIDFANGTKDKEELVEKVTCKSCRRILGLSHKHQGEPDYFLVLDTCVCALPGTATVCETKADIIEHMRKVVKDEDINVGTCNTSRFRIVGIKEVENLVVNIVPKGYDITLTKQ